MNKIKIILFSLFLLMVNFYTFSQTSILSWKILHPITKNWIDLGTKGTVQEALIQNGELPDPYVGMNEKKFDWIENYKWEFASRFYLTEQQYNSPYLEIEFPNIDTYADVYLNGKLLFKSDNAFRPYSAQIRSLVNLGYNDIKVIFTPPVLYHADQYNNEKFHLPATNDVHPTTNIAPYSRKPQYQFGWDWALRMNTIGFWKPIVLHHYTENRIIGKNLITQKITSNKADLSIELQTSLPIQGKVKWKSLLFGEMEFQPDSKNNLERKVTVQNPMLWWPRGHGDQNLYADKWILLNEENEIIDEIEVSFGIKKTELIIEPDQWGTSYFVKINDRPIFCKGGDYIPQDMFLSKIDEDDLIQMVNNMKASNFNMVRIWGGGYYPEEAFYNACDQNGIMVWQDLMFACAMYPGDEAFLNNVKSELEYQIPRIASHASIVLFNGNNEVDVAWKNWGFQKKYNIHGKDSIYVEDSYRKLFKELAPKTINSITNIPYIHTSPLSNWGKDEYYNHGTQHYWGVWHGKDPIEDFGKKSGRFNAEYGFQSFPEFSTLKSFAPENQWNLDSAVMKHHQKSYVGNGMIYKQANRLFGTPKNFEEFVYFSQLTQSKAVSIAIAGHRTGMPRCMGTLYWQINDCWQAPTWSSIDYFGNWKKLQYSTKDDYEDLAILAKITELGKEEYFMVSDIADSVNCMLQCTVYDLYGKVIRTYDSFSKVQFRDVISLDINKDLKSIKQKNYHIQFEWKYNNIVKNRSFTHIGKVIPKAKQNHLKYKILENDTINKTIVLEIENTHFVQDFWITSTKLGLKYSSNFIDYLPGKHQVKIEYIDPISLEDLKFFWR